MDAGFVAFERAKTGAPHDAFVTSALKLRRN